MLILSDFVIEIFLFELGFWLLSIWIDVLFLDVVCIGFLRFELWYLIYLIKFSISLWGKWWNGCIGVWIIG